VVPYLQFEPLNDIDKATAVSLLQAAMAMPPGGPVPSSFIAGLAEQVSNYIGLDGSSMAEDFKASFDAAAAQAKAQAAQSTAPGAASPIGQHVAALGGAVAAAQQAVANGAGRDVVDRFKKAHATDTASIRQQAAASAQTQGLVNATTEDALQAKTGGTKSLRRPGQTLPEKPKGTS
jgi:hypothetical protein